MPRNILIHLALFTVSLIYGLTFSWAKLVMNGGYLGAFGFIVLRISFASLLFFLIHKIFIKEKVEKKDHIKMGIAAFFGVAANMLMFFKGLELTTPINSAVLMLFTPVFVFVISILAGREKVSFWRMSGIIIAAAGAFFLVFNNKFSIGSETLWGDLLTIFNAISYAVYLVYVKGLLKKYHPFTVSRYTFMYGLIFVSFFGFNQVINADYLSFPPKIIAIIFFVLIATTFLTYLLNAWALQHASSSLVGAYIYLQPVLASIIAEISGTDKLNLQRIIYILIIFTGVYLVSKKYKSNED